ncbi:MAG: citramalate synthase [Clostridia bacterium]|nr:citramalate synthase [Clostridia bacterium]
MSSPLTDTRHVSIYDTTLREGSQCAGISFTLADKITLCMELDRLGVDYIEGGVAGGSPKDDSFYKEMQGKQLSHAKLVAFGPTVKPGLSPEDDRMIAALADAGTSFVTVFGKASEEQASEILGVTPEQNLEMISSTIKYLIGKSKTVFFDAEHYFDGYKASPDYSLSCLRAALDAGCSEIVLCDTNGGVLPFEIESIIKGTLSVIPELAGHFGIHVHNDSGTADYSTVEAVRLGADMAQVALNGWGERCGNANLFTVVPNLTLKLGFDTIPDLTVLYDLAHRAAETANTKMWEFSPFVGKYAFSHKAGVHIDAVRKSSSSYEHVDPSSIGNARKFMLSEQSGRAAVIAKTNAMLPRLGFSLDDAGVIVDKIKELELGGYQFEGADASFEMLVKDLLGIKKSWFRLNTYKVVVFDNDDPKSHAGDDKSGVTASAIVDVTVDNRREITADNGIGPVDALDKALRKALTSFYPSIANMYLVDYKVRVLESKLATESVVRVVIESSDGVRNWCTVGVSGDIIKASFDALVDSYTYMLDNSLGKPV